MGCDIRAFAEVQANGKWVALLDGPNDLFGSRNYAKFGFLAGVRDYSMLTIAAPRGIPADVSDSIALAYETWLGEGHTPSWLFLEELLNFDYEILVPDDEDQRVPLRKLLGNQFFQHLNQLRYLMRGPVRIVFWFDN